MPRIKSLIHCWQNGANPPDSWSPWDSLGGCIQPGFAVGRNVDGRLEVFALSSSSGAWTTFTRCPPPTGVRWSPWTSFGGTLQTGSHRRPERRRPAGGLCRPRQAPGRDAPLAVAAQWLGGLVGVVEPMGLGGALPGGGAQPGRQPGNLRSGQHQAVGHPAQAADQRQPGLAGLVQHGPAGVPLHLAHLADRGRAAPQRRAGDCPNPRRLSLGGHAQRAGAVRRRALYHLRCQEHAGDEELFHYLAVRGPGGHACGSARTRAWCGSRRGVFSRDDETASLAGDSISVIYESRDGSLWIGTRTA